MKKIPVAILGATGTVGQKFITLLEGHPYFEIRELVASQKSAGKAYRDAVLWKQDRLIPEKIASMTVKDLESPLESVILFSGLDSSVAGEAETRYANAGHWVISNSKNHRMDDDVPIMLPEVNMEHLDILKKQPYKGRIITNSNCSAMGLAMVLHPLHQAFGLELVHVTTMQAISGAGFPGVASMDILGNVIPFIGDEEEKLETETQKMLGRFDGQTIIPADFKVSAQCNRVPVLDGHTETVAIRFRKKPTVEQVKEVLRNFKAFPQEKNLPMAPMAPIHVFDEDNRPQPARDIWLDKGMAASVGRIRPCPIFDIKMVVLSHNTVRGAAGAAILNAETLVALGHIKP